MPKKQVPTHSRIDLLDAWRFIAIVMVISCHLAYHPAFSAHFSTPALSVFQSHGRVGVLIFFFISGYVVSRASLAEIAARGRFSIAAFYIRRFFRITPPIMLYLVTCLALGWLGIIPFDIGDFWAASLYLCNTGIECGWFVEHTWSLAFEEQFYLVFPLLFCWIQLKQTPWRPWALVAGCLFLVPAVFPRMGLNPFVQAHFLFLSGYLCARSEARIQEYIRRHAALIFSAATALVLFPYSLFVESNVAWFRIIFTLAIPPMVMASLLLGPAATRWIRNPALLHIGKISYSIYLWQQLATYTGYHNDTLAAEIIRILVLLPFAALLYKYFEQPLVRLGRRHSDRLLAGKGRSLVRRPGSARPSGEPGPENSPAQRW